MNAQALAGPVSLSAQVVSGVQGGREWHLDDPLGPQHRDNQTLCLSLVVTGFSRRTGK